MLRATPKSYESQSQADWALRQAREHFAGLARAEAREIPGEEMCWQQSAASGLPCRRPRGHKEPHSIL